LLAEQPLQPRLIQQHLLMRGTPERVDLLGLMLGRKGMLLEPEGDDRFEMFQSQASIPACRSQILEP